MRVRLYNPFPVQSLKRLDLRVLLDVLGEAAPRLAERGAVQKGPASHDTRGLRRFCVETPFRIVGVHYNRPPRKVSPFV